MGRYDQIIDWFKQRHDTLLDDLEPLESGLRRMMEFDGYDWRDVTPQLIAETKRKIEELELLVTIYEGRNAWPSPDARQQTSCTGYIDLLEQLIDERKQLLWN